MNLLFMQNGLSPYGIPRNGLVALYDPWRDTYGRNILPVGSEDFETGWRSYNGSTATITQNQSVVEWGTDKATRITATAGNGTDVLKYFILAGYGHMGGTHSKAILIKNIGTNSIVITGAFGEGWVIVVPGEQKKVVITFTQPSLGTRQIQLCSDVATNGFDIIAYQPQINLGQLYPYSLPAGLPQSLTDYTGRGNNAQLGSTAGADTNDPAWSGAGLTFGADDYCKSSADVFDDMPQFTCITVFKKATGSAVAGCRFFDKNNRSFAVNQPICKIAYYQKRITNFDLGIGNTTLAEGTNYIVAMCLDSTTLASKMFVGSTKQSYSITGSGSGTIAADAAYDLYTGNKASADSSISDAIYSQLWYNRILSDAEYMQAYNGLKRLMNARGVVI